MGLVSRGGGARLRGGVRGDARARRGRNSAGGAAYSPASDTRRFFFVLAAVAFFGIIIWDCLTPPPAGGDPFIYHLTFPASWLKAGRIVYVPLPYGAQAASYYPFNMELFYLWLMAPLRTDFLVNFGQVPSLLLAGLALAALARETGIGKPGAMVGAAVTMLAPCFIQQATVARVDIAFAAWFLLSLYYALRWGRTRRAGHLALFGAAVGLLIGTKPIGVLYSFLPGLLFAFQLKGRGAARAAADVCAALALALAFGGFWHVRNWLATGNPVFPLDVKLFGATIFPGAYGRGAMRAFHSSDPMELPRIGYFYLGFWLEAFLIFSGGAAMITGFVFGRRRIRGRLFLLAAPWLVIVLFWFANPYNNLTNGRFLFPAFLLFGYYAAMAIDDARDLPGRIWMWLAPVAWIAANLPVYAISFTEDTDHLYRLFSELRLGASGRGMLGPAYGTIALLTGAAVCGALLLLLKRKSILRAAAALALAALLFAGLDTALHYQNTHKYLWYRRFPVGRAWAKLDAMTAGVPVRIASVGNERSYGLFGTGLRNDVMTVNVDAHTDWQFHDYWRAARLAGARMPADSERPQWHREHGSPQAWIENLRKKDIDIVFATTLDPIEAKYMKHDALGFPVEVGWADERPEMFRLLFANSETRIFGFNKSNE